jgi:hypothetical protein
MKNFLKIVTFAFLVFLLSWIFVYKTGINTLIIQSEDTLPAMFLPVTILKEGTFYIDTYYDMLLERYPHPDDKDYEKGLVPFYLREVRRETPDCGPGGCRFIDSVRYISAFPVISGLLALPVYFFPVLLGMPITWDNLYLLSHIAAALIMALSGGFFYLLLRKHFSLNEKRSLVLTGIYLFGTINFALISQALWQHGALQLFTILGLYFLFNGLSAKDSNFNRQIFWQYFLSGLFIGLAVLARPTAALFWVILYLLIYEKNYHALSGFIKKSISYGLGMVPVVLFFLWYNYTYYLSFANQGYSNQMSASWVSNFPEGFLGVWLSPSKGILVYSPVIIFSLIGLYWSIKKAYWKTDSRYVVFGLIVLLLTLAVGLWKHWYGGWSFGYRMASDVLPFLILLIVPYLESDWFQKTKKIFIGLIIISVLVQLFGMVFFDGIWHAAYDRGFNDTSWLWSVKDSELMFNIRRVLVKLDLLERACPQCLPKSI